MATYASTTNPFLKSSACKKDAPGMAKPQGICCRDSRDKIDLINNNGDHHDNYEPKRGQEEEVVAKEGTSPRLSVSDTDEITKACENLVEATIRLELEEAAKEKSKESQSVVGEAALSSRDFNSNNIESKNSKGRKEDGNGKGDNNVDSANDNADEDDDDGADEDLENDGLEPPPMEQDTRQHLELIKKLRLQLRDIEKYAYERGELEQVPQSVLAERQTVIIDTLKERLSLKIGSDEIEKLELEELKRQIDQEIHELIDPLMAKEHLLSQLKTQLTDLERYISHLHGTIGKIHDKKSCACHVHGCLSRQDQNGVVRSSSSLMTGGSGGGDSLPKTSRLIKSLVTQLICSDVKLRELARRENEFDDMSKLNAKHQLQSVQAEDQPSTGDPSNPIKQSGKQLFSDGAAWTLHIDKVVLATDSLVNLLTIEPEYQRPTDKPFDENLVESVVRRQLVPAIKDLLSYGLIDPDSIPHPTSYAALLFDPYYILSSLTCFPSSQKASQNEKNPLDRVHVWSVVEDYYKSRNEPGFRTSSVKTLSQSFNLATSMSGPIKITSKQALLIAVDDIIETLANCKPNGPDSHFRAFIYAALNQSKLTTWLRLIFKNKSLIRKYYHNFSFSSQPDKMDKLLSTIEPLNQIEFKLRTDVESIEQFVSAF